MISFARHQHDPAPGKGLSNEDIASALVRIADLLDAQEAERFRVRAYRAAANVLYALPEPVRLLLAEEGREGLVRLPAVGRSIAALIEEYAETGRIGLLDRLEGHVSPEDIFCRVPGVSETLASRIHEFLGIETLEDLEAAAHDGRLEEVPGFGPRRIAGIRGVLDSMLGRRTRVMSQGHPIDAGAERPSVSTLLQIDVEYRSRAAAGDLRTITPTRFNPTRRSWLPILHRSRGRWHFTALYSNTAVAHRLGKTRDWVVIYYENEGHEGRCTVVTEYRGPLETQRVVRGREEECLELYSERFGWSGSTGSR